jgi:hypothetical protein
VDHIAKSAIKSFRGVQISVFVASFSPFLSVSHISSFFQGKKFQLSDLMEQNFAENVRNLVSV